MTLPQRPSSYLSVDDELVLSPFAASFLHTSDSSGFLIVGMDTGFTRESVAWRPTLRKAKNVVVRGGTGCYAIYEIRSARTVYVYRYSVGTLAQKESKPVLVMDADTLATAYLLWTTELTINEIDYLKKSPGVSALLWASTQECAEWIIKMLAGRIS